MKDLGRVLDSLIRTSNSADEFGGHCTAPNRKPAKSETAASKLDTISEEGGKANGGTTYVPKGNYQLAREFSKTFGFLGFKWGFAGKFLYNPSTVVNRPTSKNSVAISKTVFSLLVLNILIMMIHRPIKPNLLQKFDW